MTAYSSSARRGSRTRRRELRSGLPSPALAAALGLAAAGALAAAGCGGTGGGGNGAAAAVSTAPETPWKVATYRSSDSGDGDPRAAVVIEGEILDLAAAEALFLSETGGGEALLADDLLEVIAAGPTAKARLHALANHFAGRVGGLRFRVEPHRLTAPLLYPANLLAAAANYRMHAAEMDVARNIVPGRDAPYLFAKSARSGIIGTGEEYRIPPGRDRIDWEGELGVVIGEPTLRVTTDEALDGVFGYTVVFDVSDRGGRFREDPMFPGPDWFSGKSGDRAAPMGPFITPTEFLPDPQSLSLVTRVDDRVVQDGTTADMIWTVAHLVSYASSIMTLQPGDVIATGTPDGVGSARNPPEFLEAGQTVHIEIEGIGTLSTPIR